MTTIEPTSGAKLAVTVAKVLFGPVWIPLYGVYSAITIAPDAIVGLAGGTKAFLKRAKVLPGSKLARPMLSEQQGRSIGSEDFRVHVRFEGETGICGHFDEHGEWLEGEQRPEIVPGLVPLAPRPPRVLHRRCLVLAPFELTSGILRSARYQLWTGWGVAIPNVYTPRDLAALNVRGRTRCQRNGREKFMSSNLEPDTRYSDNDFPVRWLRKQDFAGLSASGKLVQEARSRKRSLFRSARFTSVARWWAWGRFTEQAHHIESSLHMVNTTITDRNSDPDPPEIGDLEEILEESEDTFKTGKAAGVKRRHLPRRKESKREMIEALVAEARIEFPFSQTPKNETNCLGLHRFFAGRLTELGVRRSTLASYCTLAVQSYFVPRESDVVAKNLSASSVAVQAQARYDATMVQHWWQVWVPIGVHRPTPTLKG